MLPALGLAAALAAGAGLRDERPAQPLEAAPYAPPAYGVLLLGYGDGREWDETVAATRRELAGEAPFEFAPGLAEGKAIAKAVAALESKRVKTIVAVPLSISSYDEVMDQNRYLFGIREKPSRGFVSRGGTAPPPPRVAPAKAALVLTRALDDSPVVADILVDRAGALGRHPPQECVALAGESPEDDEAAKEWEALAGGIADRVRQKGGFKAARAFGLKPAAAQAEREAAEGDFRKKLRQLTLECPVLVVPLALETGGLQARLRRALEGLFVRFDGKPLLPDPRVVSWIRSSGAAGSKLPDMRIYKAGGQLKGLPKLPPVRPERRRQR